MRRSLWFAGPLLAAVSAACEGVTTVVHEPTEFLVEISVSSAILAASRDTLVGDTVRFSATVTRDGEPYSSSAPEFESEDPAVVSFLDPETGVAILESVGRATVTVTFSEPAFPDSLLQARLFVPVSSYSADLSVTSSAIEARGDTLVGDTVRFIASVQRSDGRPAGKVRAEYASSDTTVVEILDDSAGLALLVSAGAAEVSAAILEPVVPGGPLLTVLPITVTDLAVDLSVSSVASAAIEAGDTLVSDSVQFGVSVVRDGDTLQVVDPTFVSSDPTVIEIVDPVTGRAFFADTGTATVTVSFTEPDVPRQSASRTIRITTYQVLIGGPAGPVMGDTVVYSVTVVDTRDGEPVAASGVLFESSDPSVLRMLDPGGGIAFARDLGQAELRAAVGEPTLPYADVEGVMGVDITEERFYGAASATSGDFGDWITLLASPVHRFTDSTRVEFPNGTVGFVETVTPGELEFRVGAGSSVGQLRLRNLVDEDGLARDTVLTSWAFEGQGTVEDPFEPNDTFPLTSDLEITFVPWIQLLSSDPSKSAPADTNFFYFRLGITARLDFIAEWQQDADLDFKICRAVSWPPADYRRSGGEPICPRDPSANSQDRAKEEELGLQLPISTYVLVFYCVDCPPEPLTYRVTVRLANN